MTALSTPAEWLAGDLDRFLRRYDPATSPTDRRWHDVASALAPGGELVQQHARFVADGASAAAAAKWVLSEHVGLLASALGFTYLRAGAAVVDLDPNLVLFGTHPDGWVQLVDMGAPNLAVLADHPWAGLADVVVLDDAAELADAVVSCVRRCGAPFVDAARRLARVGASSLWAEVADGLVLGAATEPGRPADPDELRALEILLSAPSAPWRKHPELWIAQHRGEPVVLGRKGGCCLAYQGEEPEPGDAGQELDEWSRAWAVAFPSIGGEPEYCSTCCIRDREDSAARQLWDRDWEQDHAAPTTGE